MATRTELLDLATNAVNTARTAGLYPDTDTDKAATDAYRELLEALYTLNE